MSRIGKKPVPVPSGVKAEVAGNSVKVSGPKGKLSFDIPSIIQVAVEDDGKFVRVQREGDDRNARAMHGMARAMINNMVEGVSKGYEKRLHVYGTGYGCNLAGKKLQLNCGFMGRGGKNKYQFEFDVPDGVEVEVEVAAARGDSDPAKMIIRGCDKQVVGQFAAVIRKTRPPEPYKGKGIRYHDEVVKRKAGKALAGAG
ncbi:MAG: 50S ribosomal protein L6 [Phycisphaerae bacterium]|nr:MAG: 50S ribosomal protein L6 [Phycisphaerae bacterium]